jgi:hypothetical protein
MSKTSILVLLFLALFLFVSRTLEAKFSKPEFRLKELYRYDIRRGEHKLYTTHLSLSSKLMDAKENVLFKITPFFEIRHNIRKHLWERKELGLEIGKDIFPSLYIGEAIQQVWAKEDYRYYGDYQKKNYTESETRLLLSQNLVSNKFIKLKGFILDEYTYDFNKGKGIRNEVAIGLIMPLNKYLETELNWRHIDRIHYYDSDTFEATVTLIF